MEGQELEAFRRALRDERDGDVRYRFAAVNMHENLGMTREEVALALMRCPRWVGKWVARYRSGGVEALRDRPRPGRPPLVARQKLGRLIGRMPGRVTPAEVMLEIERATGVRFHMSYVRKIMRRAGLSAKRTRLVHVNRADGPTVAGWRRRVRREIRRLRRAGFTIVVQDETIAVHGAADGSKYWSRVGVPVVAPYTGGHGRVVVYGAISTDGKQIFRVHDRFDAETFVAFLRDMHGKFGRVAVIVDRAPQHRAAAVKDYLRAHRAVRLIELPTGSPYLNAIEEVWRQAKRALLVSEHYPTMGEMRAAVSRHFRHTRYRLDVMAYLGRTSLECGTDF